MLGSRNDFIVYQKYSICDVRSQLQRSDVTYEQLFLLLYSTGKTVYDAESNLLAIAKFFVCTRCCHSDNRQFSNSSCTTKISAYNAHVAPLRFKHAMIFTDGVKIAPSSVCELGTSHCVLQRADIRQEENIQRTCFRCTCPGMSLCLLAAYCVAVPLTWVRPVTSSALQSWKWQLTGMS